MEALRKLKKKPFSPTTAHCGGEGWEKVEAGRRVGKERMESQKMRPHRVRGDRGLPRKLLSTNLLNVAPLWTLGSQMLLCSLCRKTERQAQLWQPQGGRRYWLQGRKRKPGALLWGWLTPTPTYFRVGSTICSFEEGRKGEIGVALPGGWDEPAGQESELADLNHRKKQLPFLSSCPRLISLQYCNIRWILRKDWL